MSHISTVKEYFRRIDREFPAELFIEDFQFFFPKFGIGRGFDALMELARGIEPTRLSSLHHVDDLLYIEQGNLVAAEGTTEGTSSDNVEWCGGQTPGGRFCSIFEFNDEGLIKRMHVYLDPDYTGADTARFLWPQRTKVEW
ncbi:nuclear transport factor 2 family protein [Paraburkholderia elongata]|uniref:Nuclear transport factor 2 family protein n=1 Tax=Paraburkholderia elongata TaxID=2675747 RepID=A0A972NQ44_9BURK|nr:nuclear transport factor 2 family protein [Paraburkholderia elongata]NPT56393.1 nuclear transport factor 2 family protein [Paraburkholderia elongata]